jgi:hypothetical protein
LIPALHEVEGMFHSRLAEATLIGCLTALASFCALNARAGETYSIVAQSNQFSAATGRRPLSERIAAANLPIITQTAATPPQGTVLQKSQDTAAARVDATAASENLAVAAVRVDQDVETAPAPPARPAITPPVLWPFGTKRTATTAQQTTSAKQAVATGKATGSTRQAAAGSKAPIAGRDVQRQADARSSGKGLSSSSPASVTK